MRVYHTDTDLFIELEGLQKLWAARKRVVIPKDKIGQMYWEKYFTGPTFMARQLLSTNTVFLCAGRFKIRGKWEFWYLKHAGGLFGIKAPNTLSIDMINNHEFDSVRITLSQNEAQELILWGDPHSERNC